MGLFEKKNVRRLGDEQPGYLINGYTIGRYCCMALQIDLVTKEFYCAKYEDERFPQPRGRFHKNTLQNFVHRCLDGEQYCIFDEKTRY